MQKIFFIVLCNVIGITSLYAQFPSHPDGQSGYQAMLLTSLQSGTIGIGATVGQSLWGSVDVNMTAIQYFLSDKLSNQSVNATQYRPSITFIGFGGSPISLVANAAYTIERYHSTAFQTQSNSLNGKYFSIFYGVEFKARLSPSVMSEPTFGMEYIEGTYNPINGYDSPLSSPNTRTPFMFIFPMFIGDAGENKLTITPSLRYFPGVGDEPDQAEWRLSAGFFFSTSSGE